MYSFICLSIERISFWKTCVLLVFICKIVEFTLFICHLDWARNLIFLWLVFLKVFLINHFIFFRDLVFHKFIISFDLLYDRAQSWENLQIFFLQLLILGIQAIEEFLHVLVFFENLQRLISNDHLFFLLFWWCFVEVFANFAFLSWICVLSYHHYLIHEVVCGNVFNCAIVLELTIIESFQNV